MPYVTPPVKRLTASQARALDKAEARIKAAEKALDDARDAWRHLVETLPKSAVSRHLGLSRQAVHSRLNPGLR